MRLLSVILLLLIAQISWGQLQEEAVHCKDLAQIVEMEQYSGTKHASFRANPLTTNYDVKYHRLEWAVDPAQNYISGRVTTYFVPGEEGFDIINFDLAENMQVNAAIYRGDSLVFEFTPTDNLQIQLPASLEQDILDSLTIDYEGAPEAIGFGSFVQSTHEAGPVVWTLSEPYGAKTWWPCKQSLADKVDSVDIIVRTPSEYRVASNGLLINEVTDDGDKIYHWRHRYPIPAYLIAIGVTNYEVFSDFVRLESGDSLEVLNYVFPQDLEAAEMQLESTVEIMTFFDSMFGEYPFAAEKYGHAQFGFSGGMEHQTMSFMGKFTYDLQAHELAHQWFGDKVTCGSWQDIWLNEGFATYLTGLTKEFLGTEEQFHNWKRDRVNHITGHTGGSVWVDDTTNVLRIFNGRLSYSKGAMLLHMLRWVMGDDPYFRAIRDYIAAPELVYNYARTEDLQFYLEQQSGTDLTEFFDDWLYGEGYPSYHLTLSDEDGTIQIALDQTSSHPSVDFFEMPVPVYLAGQGLDTVLRLNHGFNGQVFEVELPFTIDSVVVDPEYWLISAGNTVEYLPVNTDDVDVLGKGLSIGPNPFGDQLIVELNDSGLHISNISVHMSNGVLFQQYSVRKQSLNINTSDWPGGLYYLTVQTSSGAVVTREIVKVY